MKYNYGMHNKTPQQQAIVRQREKADELRKQESAKKNVVTAEPKQRTADYEAVTFTKGSTPILELRVSGTAIANGPCGLERESIHSWLESVGKVYAERSKSFETILISSRDVIDSKLITEWNNLSRVKL